MANTGREERGTPEGRRLPHDVHGADIAHDLHYGHQGSTVERPINNVNDPCTIVNRG